MWEKIRSLKYLGVYLDSTLSLRKHIQTKCQAAISNIRKIRQIRNYIDTDTARMLGSALVLSQLDYCNGILCGLPKCDVRKLQSVQNWAARVVLGRSRYDSATDALKTLHWLPIHQRIDHKILCIIYKCVNGVAPKYLCDLISVRSYPCRTRSSECGDKILNVPFTRKSTFADRSISVYGPKVWNALPINIRAIDNYDTFKRTLKTHLFSKVFKC